MNRSQARVVDPILSKVALGYKNEEFVGTKLMPIISCPKSGVRLMKFGKESFIKQNMRRAPGADIQEVQYGYASDPVALVQDSLLGKVPREHLRDGQDIPGVDLGSQAVNNVMESMHLGLEIEITEIALNDANYDVNNKVTLTTTDKWNDSGSKLKKQMNDYKEAIRAQIGRYPNTLTLSPKDFNALSEHQELIDKFKYTSPESLTTAMLAKYFELDNVYVGKAIWTPDEDSPFQDCWTSTVLAYVAPESIRAMGIPSYGYTYTLEGHPLVEEPWFKKTNNSWMYPTEFERRPYQTGMSAGFLIRGASD